MKAIFRSLLSKPSYLIMSVAVLGVSIAAQMGMVAVVDATLIRPPSGRATNELVFVRSSLPQGIMSFPDFVDIDRIGSLAGAFAYSSRSNTGISIGGDSILVTAGVVSGKFFPMLGAAPARGRLLNESDDRLGADPVAVVSSHLAQAWKLEVGSVIRVNTRSFWVVGILPAGFRGVDPSVRPEIWISCAQVGSVSPFASQQLITNRNIQWLRVGGRLKAGGYLANAQSELGALAQRLQKEYPAVNFGMRLGAVSFTKFRFLEDESARTMLLISGLIWFLFALAFANFFALTLLRLFTRRRELAIKLAMGASRRDIGRGLMGELAMVSALALGVGYALGRGLLLAFQLDPNIGALIETADVRIDLRSIGVVGLSVLGGAAVAWALALRQACRADLVTAIKETSSAPRRQAMVGTLYALQFAIALFLLTLAASFVDSLRTVAARRLPFRTDNLLLADVDLRALGLTGDRGPLFIDTVLGAVRKVPGVLAAGASNHPLMTPGGWTNLIVNERDPALEADKGFCIRLDVTPGFWEAGGIPALQGRLLTDADIAGQAPLAVINAACARRFWAGQNPIEKTFRAWTNGPLFQVIGVVADVPFSRAAKIDPMIYLASAQRLNSSMTLDIAVRQDSAAVRRELRQSLAAVWPLKNPPSLRPIQEQIARASADLATSVRIVLWIAAFATLVTGCGLYFFSAYTASQTLKDSAIRMALGATATDVVLAHLKKYRYAIAFGVGLGGLLLAGAAPILERFNIAVGPPRLAYAAIAALPLLAVAIVGLCVPLRSIGSLSVHRTLTGSE